MSNLLLIICYISAGQIIKEAASSSFAGVPKLVLAGKRISEAAWCDETLYGCHPVTFTDVTLQAIPYPYWNNRGTGEIAVWIKELLLG